MIIDPRPMDVVEWTDRMALPLTRFGVIQRLDDPNNWRVWAGNVLFLVGLSPASINPYTYDEWLPWAIKFSENAESILQ